MGEYQAQMYLSNATMYPEYNRQNILQTHHFLAPNPLVAPPSIVPLHQGLSQTTNPFPSSVGPQQPDLLRAHLSSLLALDPAVYNNVSFPH